MNCECPVCHEVFGGLELFDKHQNVDYSRRPAVVCAYPGSIGLVRDDWGTWRTPEVATAITQRVARMHQAKRRGA